MNLSTRTRRVTRRISVVALTITIPLTLPLTLAGGIVAPAAADWPTQPESPLVLGSVNVVPESSRHGVARATDGAIWSAWIDDICFPNLRVQRVDGDGTLLAPGGLVLQALNGCHNPLAMITALDDGTVVAVPDPLGDDHLDTTRLHRLDAAGTALWGDGISLGELLPAGPTTGRVRGILGLPGGDLMVVAQTSTVLHVLRVAPDGSTVWDEPLSIASQAVLLRVFPDLTPGSEGGVMVVWDTHISNYFRVIWAARINADGTPAWDDTMRLITPTSPFASRHTPHSFVLDGAGGVWAIYTRGGQQLDTVRPIDVQRLRADGTLEFDEPLRVSLGTTHQISATSWRDDATGDLFVAWRDGVIGTHELRVQRLTADGTRLFGPTGILVDVIAASFTPNLIAGTLTTDGPNGATLALVASDTAADPELASVRLHRIDGDGDILGAPVAISGPAQARALWSVPVSDSSGGAQAGAHVVSWKRQLAPFSFEPVVQLVQADGTLGLPAPAADLNGDGVVDGADLGILLSSWGPCDGCAADLNGDGVVDGADLGILLSAWG